MSRNLIQHFKIRTPNLLDVYATLVAASRQFGPVIEDPKKTSIHLNRRSAFAGFQTRREFLILTVKSTDDIADDRISKREQASAHRWYHEIKIGGVDEIDTRIIDWLRDSYELSS